MKKTIAILLVAILAVSSVFAAFSGKASVGFGGNLDNGNFGFIDQSTNAKIDLELATANAENVGEGDIYASIKASLVVRLYNGEKGATPDKPNSQDGKWLPIDVAIDEAKVGGENWYVSILGMPNRGWTVRIQVRIRSARRLHGCRWLEAGRPHQLRSLCRDARVRLRRSDGPGSCNIQLQEL